MSGAFLIYVIFGAVILVFVVWLLLFELRLRRFFKGEDGKNLEKVLTALIRSMEKLEKRARTSEDRLENIEQRLKTCIQKTKVVRFNPFDDVGGNQSFTAAFLDAQKNGVIISSLYGREINRTYAKSIQEGKSQYQLSEEEKNTIDLAASS